jgi:hypothetical protein
MNLSRKCSSYGNGTGSRQAHMRLTYPANRARLLIAKLQALTGTFLYALISCVNVTIPGWLAACGCVAVLMAAGCASSGTVPSTGSGAANGTGQAPSWAGSLGPGVTVEAPTRAPAEGSPQAVMTAYVRAFDARDFTAECGYVAPSDQAVCKSEAAGAGGQLAMPPGAVYDGFGLGYTLVAGARALVGATGQLCVVTQTRNCVSNSNPAAVLDSGKSFATLWRQALNAPGNAYSPVPCVRINGTWYLDTVSP